MKTAHKAIPRSALPIALLVTSTLWLVGTYQYYATTGFKPNWSATPLFWMLTVMVSPAICFAIGLILVDARKRSELSPLGWCALAAATLPGHRWDGASVMVSEGAVFNGWCRLLSFH